MPTYEYRCPDGHMFERRAKMSEAAAELPCPQCGKIATRQLSGGAGLVFKGSGFYLTDYGKNAHRTSGPDSAKSGASRDGDSSGGESKSDKSGDSKAAEAKPAESSSGEKQSSEKKPREGKSGESRTSESKSTEKPGGASGSTSSSSTKSDQ
jgi:putative FmdB family regulatory protein